MSYNPEDFEDVREDPYGCPKTDSYEKAIEMADYLRDKMRDEAWERSIEASEARKAKEGKP